MHLRAFTDFKLKFSVPFFLIFLSLLFAGCQQDNPQVTGDLQYYDVRGFVQNQIEYLKEQKPELEKSVALNSSKETVRTKDIDWEKELELFLQADINKPSYKNSYEIVKADSSMYEYRLKSGNELPVQYLLIKTDSALNKPTYLKAIIKSENRIYGSEREIELHCVLKDQLLQLDTYHVKGYQELIFTDRKNFSISGKIGL